MAESRFILGSTLRFDVRIASQGFNQDEDDYTIDIYCGNKKLSYDQDDVIIPEQGDGRYLYVDTSLLVAGAMKMVVTATIKDTYSDDPEAEVYTRKEIAVKNIGTLESIKNYGVPECQC